MVDLKKNEEQITTEILGKINLSKDKQVLGEHVINLSKTVVNLSKENGVDLGDKKARVVVVLDYSGSMRKMYNDGTVQDTLNRLVPLGLKFDDNGTIDTYVFRDDFIRLKDLNIDNYSNYVAEEITKKVDRFGRTVYSPVLRDIYNNICRKNIIGRIIDFFKKIFGLKVKDDTVFVLFITDGGDETGDYVKCDNVISDMSRTNCFIQFIGIGDNKFKYFERLPKIKNRQSNNTGSTIISKLNTVTDNDLYNVILKDFVKWIR